MAKTTKAKTSGDSAAKAASSTKKIKKVLSGKIYINASYNNTIVSVTDEKGNIIAWATAGSLGFSGPKKATPFAASKIMSVIIEKLKASGTIDLDVVVKGVGSGRDSAVRSLLNQGFNINSIKDVTPVPHNGPRPAKTRRV
ncbi:MAG: 30S ribosomal protein S11 [Parcubacteria group bacterium LiPW_15]|nr:MAG: 30S ribosomal protein S11 [Parcubacteria group bacterium LiPW_15]